MKYSVRQYVDTSVRRVLTYSRTHVLSSVRRYVEPLHVLTYRVPESRDSLTPRPMIQSVPLCQLVPISLALVTRALT